MYILYPDMTVQEREKALQRLAVKTKNETYQRSLQQEEIDNEKDRYATKAIDKDNLQKEAKNVADDYKGKIANLDKMMDEALERIKTGKYECTGALYGIANYSESRMMFYDKYGELIKSRALLPDEYQGAIKFIGEEGLPQSENETPVTLDGNPNNEHIETAVVVGDEPPLDEGKPDEGADNKETTKPSAKKKVVKGNKPPKEAGEEKKTPERKTKK